MTENNPNLKNQESVYNFITNFILKKQSHHMVKHAYKKIMILQIKTTGNQNGEFQSKHEKKFQQYE